jgi:voltage-gated potassium channel
MQDGGQQGPESPRQRLRRIIFEADTPAGKAYDVALLVVITLSVAGVMLDSVARIRGGYGRALTTIEWVFTFLLTMDYVVRLWCVGRPLRYALSFFGIVDLLGVIPTYLGLLVRGSRYLVAIRFLRVLRVFRVLNLSSYLAEYRVLTHALMASRRRIAVFLFVVMTLVVVLGSLMYVVEGEENGFTSIPVSIYWAIVTLTTVGYGDISPATPFGRAIAAVIMIIGYSIIVVPTGIVSVEMSRAADTGSPVCPSCGLERHDGDAAFCKRCGGRLGKG